MKAWNLRMEGELGWHKATEGRLCTSEEEDYRRPITKQHRSKAPLLFFLCPLYHPLLLTEPSNTKLLTHATFLANHSKNGYIGNLT